MSFFFCGNHLFFIFHPSVSIKIYMEFTISRYSLLPLTICICGTMVYHLLLFYTSCSLQVCISTQIKWKLISFNLWYKTYNIWPRLSVYHECTSLLCYHTFTLRLEACIFASSLSLYTVSGFHGVSSFPRRW